MDKYLIKCDKGTNDSYENLDKKRKNVAEVEQAAHAKEPVQSTSQQCGQYEGINDNRPMSPMPNDDHDVPMFALRTEYQNDVIDEFDVLDQPADLSDPTRTSAKKPCNNGPHGEWNATL